MLNIPDDPIISSLEATGLPPWCQEILEDFDDEPGEEDEMPEELLVVLAKLRIGKDKAITREDLAASTGLSDRAVRKAIEKLRRTYIIINDGDGKGYYRSYKLNEIERSYRQERARALAVLYRLQPMREMLRGCGRL